MIPDDQNRTVNPAGEPKVEGLGQPESEFVSFESLMKRLLKVPKKEIDARREAERKRA